FGLHQLGEGRNEEMLRRDLVGGRAGARNALVLDTINADVRPADLLIDPVVRDDPRARRMIAGEESRMARAGLGRGVALVAVAEHGARREAREAAGELRAIFVEEIRGELVDGDDDEKLRR